MLRVLANNLTNPDTYKFNLPVFGLLEWWVSYSSYTILEDDGSIPGFEYLASVDFPAVLPGECDVEVSVTSSDVIHCWTVNGLGVKVDAVPGRINSVHLSNLRPGYTAWGGCSEMCGVNHYQMSIELEVLSKADFCIWGLMMIFCDMKMD